MEVTTDMPQEARRPQRVARAAALVSDAKRFYEKAGFSASPIDPMTMTITLADVEKALRRR